ncbi:MAG: ATP-binding protein [Gemmatimonadota bacterium]
MNHRPTRPTTPDPTRIQAALAALGEGITLADRSGRITYSNPAADEILGTGPSGAPPEEWAEHYGVFIPGTNDPFPAERYPLVRALRREATNDVEMSIRNRAHPEGILISVSGRPVTNGDGEVTGAAVVFRDVTALRNAEAELRRTVVSLRELQAQKDELIGFLVHDMQGPLTAILASANLMETDAGRSAHDLEGLAGIADGARSLHRMVLDLLDIQMGEDGRLEPVLERVRVLPVLQRAAAGARARGRVVAVDVEDALEADADPELLRRVVANLVANCVKYCKEGTPISVAAVRTGSGGLRLSVRDEGPGVPTELRDAVFEKYARLERDTGRRHRESRGLGLRFCKVAVEAHGGRIWVEDNEPTGAAFVLELPGRPNQHT